MKNKLNYTLLIFLSILLLTSCESEAERKQRQDKEELQRVAFEEKRQQEAAEIAFQQEQERMLKEEQEEADRLEREKRLEKERREKEIYDTYINNSLNTGNTPYAYCYGSNNTCSDYGCSEIKVRTPSNSDVMVTIKRDGKVYRHAYIRSGSSYTFEFPNGVYQAFFYYGRGWNPEKVMTETDCGTLYGGFIADEHFGKDNPQSLSNNILNYELILQQNGNFSTKPSSPDEAF